MNLEQILTRFDGALLEESQDIAVLNEVSKRVIEHGGAIYLVGGFPRDLFTRKKNKDLDVEIYGLTKEELKKLLLTIGTVNEVGASFGVFKVKGCDIDFSLPRREIQAKVLEKESEIRIPPSLESAYLAELQNMAPSYKIVTTSDEVYGHQDFVVIPDPYLSVKEASRRRDFTMNALMLDLATGEILDMWKGREDIENHVIRHIDAKTFIEDPLRVFRACQFASRFGFSIAPETLTLCQRISLDGLPKERVFEEVSKALLKGIKPSVFFEYLRVLGVIEHLFPELEALIHCPQRPDFHPEGNVWNHTMLVLDEASKLRRDEAFLFGALCHDMGKPHVLNFEHGQITSHGHDIQGVDVARRFMHRLTQEGKLIQEVLNIVENHMRPHHLYLKASAKALRKFAYEVDIETILLIAEADFKGRAVQDKDYSQIRTWFMEGLRSLGADKKIERLVTGKDLIALGLKPGKEFGELLRRALDLQLEGFDKQYIIDVIISQ